MFDLPEQLSPADFETELDDTQGLLVTALRQAAETIAKYCHLSGETTFLPGGSNAVFQVGSSHVIKLFPPFHRYQWETEWAVFKCLDRLSLPVQLPQLLFGAEARHWGYLVMTRLPGRSLEGLWSELPVSAQCQLLETLGQTMQAVHQLPAECLPSLDPAWDLFWEYQQKHCLARHQRQGLPAHFLAELPTWLASTLPGMAEKAGPPVLLTGEYTPQNLQVQNQHNHWKLTGMLDFADSLIGPAAYDWLGPICFLVQGQRPQLEALFRGYGWPQSTEVVLRREALSYLFLHRYSNPRFQIRIPGWQAAADLEALATLLWPV